MSDNDIPEYFKPAFFQRALEHGLRLANIIVHDLKVENITLGGENYCSDIYRAEVRYSIQDDDTENEQSLIVKSLPKAKQGILGALNIYTKETVFYVDIIPKIEALMWQIENNWTLGAKHFYSTSYPEQTIFSENLCLQGFELQSRQLGLDVDHARLVMKKLGQYHALTMAMKLNDPQTIVDRFPFGLLNIDSIRSEAFKVLFGGQLLKLISLLNGSEEFQPICVKLDKFYENFTERILKSVYPLRGEFNVLNHGDLWVNNLLFKHDGSSAPTEVRFIDFQLCFYGSLGFDVNYFLNTSVHLNVLKHHRQSLIEIYFDSLTRTLKKLPYDRPLPKYEEILFEIRQREGYGFFVAFGFFPLMSMFSGDSQDNSLEKLHDASFASKKIELMFKSNTRTMETLKYAIKRLNDLGVLD